MDLLSLAHPQKREGFGASGGKPVELSLGAVPIVTNVSTGFPDSVDPDPTEIRFKRKMVA